MLYVFLRTLRYSFSFILCSFVLSQHMRRASFYQFLLRQSVLFIFTIQNRFKTSTAFYGIVLVFFLRRFPCLSSSLIINKVLVVVETLVGLFWIRMSGANNNFVLNEIPETKTHFRRWKLLITVIMNFYWLDWWSIFVTFLLQSWITCSRRENETWNELIYNEKSTSKLVCA